MAQTYVGIHKYKCMEMYTSFEEKTNHKTNKKKNLRPEYIIWINFQRSDLCSWL